jgi:BioD-like phosphotransacetylase family protein
VDGLPLVDTEGGAIGIASASLTSRLQAKVIGVTPYARSLGSAELAVWKDAFGDALAGVVINRAPLHADHDVHERLALEFDAASVPLLGVLAEERFMLAPTVRQVVDLLEGTVYAGASQDQLLIENFLIGGLVTEWGGNYFGRLPNQGVIVRGGRIDIQMAALNFPLNCLVLTGCESPPQYVYQRAEGQDVPLVVVASDTHETTTALEEIADRVNVRHLEKVTRLAGGLESALDWEAFRAAAGLG